MGAKVSIIVPCYNQAHYLLDTINSIRHQTYENFECIIVNDGSSDNTEAIAQSAVDKDGRFQLINQMNQGLSSARNTGIKQASGAYVQLLDADDLIEEEKVSQEAQYLDDDQSTDIVFNDSVFFSDNSGTRSYEPCPHPKNPEIYQLIIKDFLAALIVRNRIPSCAPLIRKQVFEKCGLFNETLFSLEDWEFWLRCCLNGIHFQYNNTENAKSLVRQSVGSMRSNSWKMTFYELKVRYWLHEKLNNENQRINSNLIYDRLKTALYYAVEDDDTPAKISDLQTLKQNKKLDIIKTMLRAVPRKYHKRMIWLMMESPGNVIKGKF